MTKEEIKNILVIVVGIALIIVAIKFFVKVLPLILIALGVYFIYKKVIANNDDVKPTEKPKKGHKKVIEGKVISEKNSND